MSIADAVIQLGPADEVVQGLAGRLSGLVADTPEGYEAVRMGIAEVRKIRVGVEKSRKQLKQSALDYGRKVDAEAKRVTALLSAIEEPLKLEKKRIDDREAIERAEKAAAIQAEAEAKAKAIEEEKQRQLAEERARIEAERKKMQEERAALEAERQRLEQERQAREAAEQEKLAAERAQLQAERDRLDKERQAREAAEREAKEKAQQIEREKQAKLEADRVAKQRESEEKERRPDCVKLAELAYAVNAIKLPDCKTSWGKEVVDQVADKLGKINTQIGDAIENS